MRVALLVLGLVAALVSATPRRVHKAQLAADHDSVLLRLAQHSQHSHQQHHHGLAHHNELHLSKAEWYARFAKAAPSHPAPALEEEDEHLELDDTRCIRLDALDGATQASLATHWEGTYPGRAHVCNQRHPVSMYTFRIDPSESVVTRKPKEVANSWIEHVVEETKAGHSNVEMRLTRDGSADTPLEPCYKMQFVQCLREHATSPGDCDAHKPDFVNAGCMPMLPLAQNHKKVEECFLEASVTDSKRLAVDFKNAVVDEIKKAHPRPDASLSFKLVDRKPTLYERMFGTKPGEFRYVEYALQSIEGLLDKNPAKYAQEKQKITDKYKEWKQADDRVEMPPAWEPTSLVRWSDWRDYAQQDFLEQTSSFSKWTVVFDNKHQAAVAEAKKAAEPSMFDGLRGITRTYVAPPTPTVPDFIRYLKGKLVRWVGPLDALKDIKNHKPTEWPKVLAELGLSPTEGDDVMKVATAYVSKMKALYSKACADALETAGLSDAFRDGTIDTLVLDSGNEVGRAHRMVWEWCPGPFSSYRAQVNQLMTLLHPESFADCVATPTDFTTLKCVPVMTTSVGFNPPVVENPLTTTGGDCRENIAGEKADKLDAPVAGHGVFNTHLVLVRKGVEKALPYFQPRNLVLPQGAWNLYTSMKMDSPSTANNNMPGLCMDPSKDGICWVFTYCVGLFVEKQVLPEALGDPDKTYAQHMAALRDAQSPPVNEQDIGGNDQDIGLEE